MVKSLLRSRRFQFGAGLVAGLAVFGVALASQSTPEGPKLRSDLSNNSPISGVCAGSETTFAEARGSSRVPVFMPEHALANRDNLRSSWDCNGDQIAFEFGSRVRVYLSMNTLSDPAAEYASLAAQNPEYTVGVVRGVPAALVNPADGNGTARGGVDLVQNGIRIIVAGDGEIPVDNLIEVAESLRRDQ